VTIATELAALNLTSMDELIYAPTDPFRFVRVPSSPWVPNRTEHWRAPVLMLDAIRETALEPEELSAVDVFPSETFPERRVHVDVVRAAMQTAASGGCWTPGLPLGRSGFAGSVPIDRDVVMLEPTGATIEVEAEELGLVHLTHGRAHPWTLAVYRSLLHGS
jgi:hypothetical protein